jgi:hypothetical protein
MGSSASATAPSIPPPPRPRNWVVPVTAIVVGAIVIIALLAAVGLVFHKAGTPSPGPYTTLDEAEVLAGPAAAHVVPGNWSPVLAVGVRVGSNASVPTSGFPLNVSENLSGCQVSGNLTPLRTLPANLAVSVTPASAAAGHAAAWIVGLSNGSGGIVLVAVLLDVATPLYSLSYSSCLSTSAGLAPFPSAESDSPALVAATNASGGASFLQSNPGAAQLWAGVGGFSAFGLASAPEWEVVDTSCPLPLVVNETGTAFNATLKGAPAEVVNHTSGSLNCAAGLGSGLSGLPLVSAAVAFVSKAI